MVLAAQQRWTLTDLFYGTAVILFVVLICAAGSGRQEKVGAITAAKQQQPQQQEEPRSEPFDDGGVVVRKFAATDAANVLNVHVVSHTHDDTGWRKTVEQYFRGLNASLADHGSVENILTTVVESLLANPSRTFSYAEVKFFSMWWEEQSDAVKDSVRALIADERLDFVNGGWCMHDEASAHYVGMIDQTTTGHDFLRREFGVVPTVAWQVDPFGHSSTQASLLTSRAGMDALYFGRMDHQDMHRRFETAACEGLWEASSNLNRSTIFWGLTGSFAYGYSSPPGFRFEPGQDSMLALKNQSQLEKKVEHFLLEMALQSNRTQGHHVMVTFGSDFSFYNAHVNYANIDLLISSIMNFQKWGKVDAKSILGPKFDSVNIFYSNPAYYTKKKYEEKQLRSKLAKASTTTATAATARHHSVVAADDDDKDAIASKSSSLNWTVKRDDFFPLAHCDHCYWTGFYTSRTSFKRQERVASSFLLAARQIEAIMGESGGTTAKQPLFALEDALGVAQHHDGLSGTEKQHVAYDYSKKLQIGMDAASRFAAVKLKEQLLVDPPTLENFQHCQLLNETICSVSEEATVTNGTDVFVFVYNGLVYPRSAVVRLPVSSDSEYRVEPVDTGIWEHHRRQQVTPIPRDEKYVVVFDTGPLPPVGGVAFKVTMLEDKKNQTDNIDVGYDSPSSAMSSIVRRRRLKGGSEVVEVVPSGTDDLKVIFDSSTGMIRRISMGEVSLDVTQKWGYYTSYDSSIDNSTSDQNSGAYVFRPSAPNQDLVPLTPAKDKARFVTTPVGMEVHVSFEEDWLKQVTRVQRGAPYVEFEYTVGPIPIGDGRGKEIVTRFNAPIANKGIFWTDSNGREFVERKRDHRPSWNMTVFEPVAGNYYPVNAAIGLEDPVAALAVVVDRSQGGSSIRDGSVELMVQRRILADDGLGVDEPLNETCDGIAPYPPYGNAERLGTGIVVRGVHRVAVGKGGSAAGVARKLMDGAFAEPVVFVGSSPATKQVSFRRGSFSALRAALPKNLMLVTLMRLEQTQTTTFLLRLGHQYAPGEDATLSKFVDVDLSMIFVDYNVVSVVEKTLTGNQDWDEYLQRRMDWTNDDAPNSMGPRDDDDVSASTIVTMRPMEIRTFEVKVEPV